MALDLNYEPQVFFDGTGMSQEEWEPERDKYSKISSSGCAAVFGDGHKTNIDYYRELLRRKLGIERVPPSERTAFKLKFGHIAERMVAEAFVLRHPEWELVEDNRMCCHPLFPFMTCNIDFLIRHKMSGRTAILECKFVNPDTEFAWKKGAPKQYEWQVRHAMSVWNINEAYVTALWGNDPFENGIDWSVLRDLNIEEYMIAEEAKMWTCVETETPPMLSCNKLDVLKAFLAKNMPSHSSATTIMLPPEYAEIAREYIAAKEAYAETKAQADTAQCIYKEAEAQLMLALGDHSEGCVTLSDGTQFSITAKPKNENTLNTAKLESEYPEVYKQVAVTKVTLGSLKEASLPAYNACVVEGMSATERTFKIRAVRPT